MKLGQQVVLLELSKELKEAGYKQEGLWTWGKYLGCDEYGLDLTSTWEKVVEPFVWIAPTVAELGEALDKQTKYAFATYKSCGKWFCFDINNRGFYKEADTEANANARMDLYLKKENLL